MGAWRVGAGGVAMEDEVLPEDQPAVHASGPVEGIKGASRFLIDTHDAYVRVTEQRALDAHYAVVDGGIRPIRARLHVHDSDLIIAQRARQLSPCVHRDHLTGVRIDPDLTTEKEQVLESGRKVEDAGVLQEELPLLGEEDSIRRQVELLLVDVGVSKVRIDGQVGHQARPQAVLDIHAPSVEKVGPGAGRDRKSTRLNSSHPSISYAVFCLKKKKKKQKRTQRTLQLDKSIKTNQ